MSPQESEGNSLSWALDTRGGKNLRFGPKLPFITETERKGRMITELQLSYRAHRSVSVTLKGGTRLVYFFWRISTIMLARNCFT